MLEQDVTTREAAEAIGEDFEHLANAIAGRSYPSALIRDRLPELLGVALEECFTPESLRRKYRPRRKAVRS